MFVLPVKKRKLRKFSKGLFNFFVLLAIALQPVGTTTMFSGGFFVPKAQADEDTVVPADDSSTETPSETVVAEEEETANAETNEKEATAEVNDDKQEVAEKVAPPQWEQDGDKASIGPVALDVTYKAPQNDEVTVTFTKLPKDPGTLTLEEITLSDEQKEALGALSDKAYDITSDMENGSFEYELTLPIPEGQEGLQVKYADDTDDLNNAKTVDEDSIKTKKDSIKATLDHFTIFVVTQPALVGGACTSAGATSSTDCYATIQEAIDHSSSGNDTIKVKDGTYAENLDITNKEGITIEGESKAGTIIQTTGVYGININNSEDIVFKNLTIEDQAAVGGYQVKVYLSEGVEFYDVNVQGNNQGLGGSNSDKRGGLDFNSTKKIIIEDVSIADYTKNGLAFTAVCNTPFSIEDITIEDSTIEDIGWSAIAFYTNAGPSCSPSSADITGVKFVGTNTVKNAGQWGLQIGDLGDLGDREVSQSQTKRLELQHMVFAGSFGSGFIINVQKKDVGALEADFNGQTDIDTIEASIVHDCATGPYMHGACSPLPAPETLPWLMDLPGKYGSVEYTNLKINICHATSSESHSYEEINVSISAVNGSCHVPNGHSQHQDDIIPPYTLGACSYPGKNWTPENQTFLESGCEPVPVCGDGIVSGDEVCDYGERNGESTCSSSCQWEAPVCSAEEVSVTNGEFEVPDVTHGAGWDIFDSSEVPGWTAEWYGGSASYQNQQRPDPKIEIHGGVNGWTTGDDQYVELDTDWVGPDGALNGEPASISLYQDMPTVPGKEYTISFYYAPRPGHNDNRLVAEINGSEAFDSGTIAGLGGAPKWKNETITFTATGSVTELRFTERGVPDSLGMFLDNVHISCQETVPDVQITKIDDIDPIVSGNILTYTLTAKNNGPVDAEGVVVTDTLPANFVLQSVVPSTGACSDKVAPDIACELGTLANGAEETVTVTGVVLGSGTLENTAAVSTTSGDTNQDNNTDTEETTVAEKEVACLNNKTYASSVIAFNQGPRKNNTPVLATRSIPASVLGTPDATTSPDSGFYSLGQGGSITVKFSEPIADVLGTDLSFHEVTNGRNSYPLETAKVEVSQDGVTWSLLPLSATSEPGGDGVVYLDFASTGLSTIEYVRITDTTNFGDNGNADADGYDIDAIDATCGSGTITIQKETLPDGDQTSFEFTPSWGDTFTLADGGSTSVALVAGTYSVSELEPEGWTGTGICTSSYQNEESPENISLQPGENITCTFTNHKNIQVTASKIVCADEADLPNWGAGGPNITPTTASIWVKNHPSCKLVPDWSFQWSEDNVGNPGDNTGAAGGAWHTFGSTQSDGTVTVQIPGFGYTPRLWFREVWDDQYIPFTHDAHPDNSDNVSAEFYCNDDVLNYDNWDWINTVPGGTYNCVAWNVEKRGSLTIVKDAEPNDAQDFTFTTVGEGLPAEFALDDDEDDTLSNTQTFGNLTAGQYAVTEAAVAGWDLANVTCLAEGSQIPLDLPSHPEDNTVNLNLTPGENITCTFTNHKVVATVQMCKLDQNNRGLPGWNLVLQGAPVQSGIQVPTNTSAGINSNPLVDGVSYLARASGTWTNQNGINPVDAEYSTTDGWTTHMDGYTGYSTDILELQINNTFDPNSNWGSYNSDHQYAQSFVQSGNGPANFRIFDGTDTTQNEGWFGDNSGTLNVDLSQGYAGVTGQDGCVTFENVPFGTYTADEILKDDWENLDGKGEVVTVDNVDEVFTLVNREKPGTITIVKDAVNNSSQNFSFKTNFDVSPAPGTQTIFQLDDDNNGLLPNNRTFTLQPGTYTVQEGTHLDWKLTDLTCNDQNGSVDLENRQATITLDPNENVICTFTNTQLAFVKGWKFNDRNANGQWDIFQGEFGLGHWNIFVDQNNNQTYDEGEPHALTSDFFLTRGFYFIPEGMLPGTYQICEEMQSGWTNTTPLCQSVTLSPGDVEPVIFGNSQQGTITIQKETLPDGDQTSFEFTPSWGDTFTLADGGSTSVALVAGTYSVSELEPEGWTGTGICTSSYQNEESPENISLQPGENITCTFTNEQDATLTVYKVDDLDEDGFYDEEESTLADWEIHLGEMTQTTDESGSTIFHIPAGNYVLSEALQKGWEQTGLYCTNEVYDEEGTQELPLTLAPGEELTCYVLNHFVEPAMRITKTNDSFPNIEEPGNTVEYTLTITSEDAPAEDVEVTDLPPAGFTYVPGSAEATSDNGDHEGPLELSHEYASPGVWSLGTLAAGETVTLKYQAIIGGSQDDGTYNDLAYATGQSTRGTSVVANDPSDSDAFAGTQVAVGGNNAAEVEIDTDDKTETTTKKQYVLGASLPATGASALLVLLIIALLGIGSYLYFGGRRKKLHQALIVLIGFSGLAFAQHTQAASNIAVSMESPEPAVQTTNFKIGFVALDIQGRELTVKCYGGGVVYDTHTTAAGGGSGDCQVNALALPAPDTYVFYVTAEASGEGPIESNHESITYAPGAPGTPTDYDHDNDSDACKDTITFHTASDGGRTTAVEVYRSKKKSFTADTPVVTIAIGSDTNGQTVLTPPDCDKDYFYAIRAIDTYGFGSDFVGDTDVDVKTKKKTRKVTLPGEATTTGAIPVANASSGAAQEGQVEGAQTGEEENAQVLGEATENPEGVASAENNWFEDHKILSTLLGLIILGGLYFVLRWYRTSLGSNV